ncbi:MAG TPA: sigma-70 family RNA polymerase sigma factor [Verrucomicrobiae bacterium]
MNDTELLREYARSASDSAFAALVERHAGIVYSAALRQVRDPHHAQDITQAVFVVLARKAGRLARHPSLAGWLLLATRYAANAHIRAAVRRSQREQEAIMQSNPTESYAAEWIQLEPLLDEAMASLGEIDRAALALRYFENRTAAEIGLALHMQEEAAKKRTGRALDKLRKFITRRGVMLSAIAITGAITANSVQAAPAGLVAKISLATAKGATTTTLITAITKGIMKNMMWNNLRISTVTGIAVILAVGTTVLVAQHADKPVEQAPYQWFEDAALFEQSVNHTNLALYFLIGSTNKGVKPADIHLTINSPSQGKISVKVGDKGQILNFPCDEDLRKENPNVEINQPMDSLSAGKWIWVPLPDKLTFRYDRFTSAVDEANQAAVRAHALPDSNPVKELMPYPGRAEGVALVFPKGRGDKAKITIQTAAGPKEYFANAQGVIPIRINPDLRKENPLVTLSEKPSWITVWPW